MGFFAPASASGSGVFLPLTGGTLTGPLAGTTLALGGATIGTDALGITGTATISGLATAGSVIVTGTAGITTNLVGAGIFVGAGSANRVALSSNTAGDITSFSGGRIGFTSTATSAAGAPDTFWSRVAAGQMGSNGSVSTAAPAGSSAGAWKLGALQTGAAVLDTTRSIFVDIGGTVYKLMVAQ